MCLQRVFKDNNLVLHSTFNILIYRPQHKGFIVKCLSPKASNVTTKSIIKARFPLVWKKRQIKASNVARPLSNHLKCIVSCNFLWLYVGNYKNSRTKMYVLSNIHQQNIIFIRISIIKLILPWFVLVYKEWKLFIRKLM